MNLDITSFLPFLRNPFKLAFCSSEKLFSCISPLNSSMGKLTISILVMGHQGGIKVSSRLRFGDVDVPAVGDSARDHDGNIPIDLGEDPEQEGWEKTWLDMAAELEGCGSS